MDHFPLFIDSPRKRRRSINEGDDNVTDYRPKDFKTSHHEDSIDTHIPRLAQSWSSLTDVAVQEVLSLPWAQTLSTESTFVEQVMQQVSADLMLDMKEPPVELGGLKIRRLRLALVDTDGTEYPRPGGPTALTDLEEVQRKLTHDPSTLRSAYVGDTRLLQILPAKVYILSDEGASTTIQTALASLYLHPYSEIVRVDDSWHQRSPDQQERLYFETKVVFDGVLKPVSDFLEGFFEQKDPGIDFSAWLGSDRDFVSLESLDSIVLRGVLRNMHLKLFDIIEFREIGIELSACEYYDAVQDKTLWDFGWGFFGKLNIMLQSNGAGINVDYLLQHTNEVWQLCLRLTSNEWKGAFGIERLTLSEVQLVCELDRSMPKQTELSFLVTATMTLRQSVIQISGSYSKDSWELSVFLGDLTLSDVGEIVHELTGFKLDVFEHDVKFDAMSLIISSERIALAGAITIQGHTSVAGSVVLSQDGVSLSGSVGDITFDKLGLTVKEAGLDVFIASKFNGPEARSTSFSIRGAITYHGIDAKAALYLKKNEKLKEWVWAIYGEVQGDMSTPRLLPALRGSEVFDMSLKRVAIIASTENLGAVKGVPYAITSGVRVCAELGRIPILETLVGGNVDGMVLSAAYTKKRFELQIALPAARTIRFNDSVSTGPIALSLIVGGGSPMLQISATLLFQVGGQPDDKPLELEMALGVTALGGEASVDLKTPWHNPCNAGKDVVINVASLQIGIQFATFLSKGPSEFGFLGNISVGSKSIGFGVKFSDNPKQQLLEAKQEDLSAQDLVDFASLIAERKLPPVPQDLLHIHYFRLVLSTGATIASTTFPAGAFLDGDMTIFGKRAKFNCEFSTLIKIYATIEHFSLGPLSVHGTEPGSDPIVDIEFSTDTQKILIDGAIDIWDASVALHVDIEIMPKIKFHFYFCLKLSDLFLLQLNADLVGKVVINDYKTWAEADFVISGIMEQAVIDHIATQLKSQLDSAQEATKVGFKQARLELEEEEKNFERLCDKAAAELADTRKSWDAKQKEVNDNLAQASAAFVSGVKKLQDAVGASEQLLRDLLQRAEDRFEQTNSDVAGQIKNAYRDLNAAQMKLDEEIRVVKAEVNQITTKHSDKVEEYARELEKRKSNALQKDLALHAIKMDVERMREEYKNSHFLSKMDRWGKLQTAEGTLKLFQNNFDELKQAYTLFETGDLAKECMNLEIDKQAALTRLAAIENTGTLTIQTLKSNLQKLESAQNKVAEETKKAIDDICTQSSEAKILKEAKLNLAQGTEELQRQLSDAKEKANQVVSTVEGVTFSLAVAALQTAKSNTKQLNLKREALDSFEDAAKFGADLANLALRYAQETFNIREIRFSGSVRCLVHPDGSGPPLYAEIKGTVLTEEIFWKIVWKPEFDLVKFIQELFTKLKEKLYAMTKHPMSIQH